MQNLAAMYAYKRELYIQPDILISKYHGVHSVIKYQVVYLA